VSRDSGRSVTSSSFMDGCITASFSHKLFAALSWRSPYLIALSPVFQGLLTAVAS
jgi:hypothetical protein